MNNQTLSQRSWEWIKSQPNFHSNELAKIMDIELHSAQMVIDHLKKLGCVITTNSNAKPVVYAAVKHAAPHLPGKNKVSPQPNSIRQKIWQAIRWTERFTIDEIASLAECSRNSVERYVSDLRKYGYVARLTKPSVKVSNAKRKGVNAVYRLIKNTGPKYPVIGQKCSTPRDQNTGEKLVPLEKKNGLV